MQRDILLLTEMVDAAEQAGQQAHSGEPVPRMMPCAVVEREPGLGQRPGDRTGKRADGIKGGQRPTGPSLSPDMASASSAASAASRSGPRSGTSSSRKPSLTEP
jgi:hypothetical protein